YFADGGNIGSPQSVEIVDADSGEVLDQRTIRLTSEGEYWTWSLSGKVRFHLKGIPTSVLNGVFFGGSAKVSFLDYDPNTHGSWKRIYGHDGAWISQNALRPPAYADLRIYGGQGPADVPNFSSRIETFYNTNRITDALSGEIDLVLKDLEPHEIALYFMRGDAQPAGKVLIVDGLSNRVLDMREVSRAYHDEYLVWNISGHVKIIPSNCQVSALFLAPVKKRPLVQLYAPAAHATFEAPATVSLKARIDPTDALVDRVEFYNGDQLLGTSLNPPFEFDWTDVLVGHYTLKAVVYDGLASNTTSDTSEIDVGFPTNYFLPVIQIIYPLPGDTFVGPAALTAACFLKPGSTRLNHTDFFIDGKRVGESSGLSFAFEGFSVGHHVLGAKAVDELGGEAISSDVSFNVTMPRAQTTFLLTDLSSRGDWNGLFGSEGYIIPGLRTNLPQHILVTDIGAQTVGWQDRTDDPRALQYPNTASRLAAAWTDESEISMELSFLDGKEHLLAFYFLDWDGGGRAETASIYDADSDELLDNQEVLDFRDGKYSIFNVRGRIRVQVRTENSRNVVLSGLFVDKSDLQPSASLRLKCTSRVLQNGNLEMVVLGRPFVAYVLEKSADFLNWVAADTMKSPSGIVPFVAPQAVGDERQFFRVRERDSAR
ncbi:MAG: hypothetical protein JWM99_1754, partial [Verrucomicrobiales bacterium]|nr:hypothetical protein [Verrucomicrobiales bacterium]